MDQKSRKVKESVIVSEILRELNSIPGCYAVKIHGDPYLRKGTPDILGSYRGHAFALEVKRPGGKPTTLQIHELGKWMEAGALIGVVSSVEDAKRALERVDTSLRGYE